MTVLPKKFQDLIKEFPENGMNYQLINITFKDGSVKKNTVVINGSIIKHHDFDPETIAEVSSTIKF